MWRITSAGATASDIAPAEGKALRGKSKNQNKKKRGGGKVFQAVCGGGGRIRSDLFHGTRQEEIVQFAWGHGGKKSTPMKEKKKKGKGEKREIHRPDKFH